MKLTDSIREQAILEILIEGTKPKIPPDCAHLDHLLSSPFRYGPYPNGSRFRRTHQTQGAFYAGGTPDTAAAEAAFYRLLFFIESPGTPWPNDAAELSAFSVTYQTEKSVDLMERPFDVDASIWRHPINYALCQELADTCRSVSIEAIRYGSVRDPGGGHNIVLLTPAALTCSAPIKRQTWRLFLSDNGVRAICEFPHKALDFNRADFSVDPRVAGFDWKRPSN